MNITQKDLLKPVGNRGNRQVPGGLITMKSILRGGRSISNTIPKTSRKREFSQLLRSMLPSGSWSGRRCFIVGGGPSLKDFDWDLLRGEISIGINRAFEFFDPTLLFSMDNRFWMWIERGLFGDKVMNRFREYRYGLKVWVDVVSAAYSEDIITVPCKGSGVGIWSESLEEGVGTGANSGYAALNLAYLLGANPIYLLGFDMQGDPKTGLQRHFHDGYPNMQKLNVYYRFNNEFKKIAAPALRNANREVINLNPKSDMTCFPRKNWRDAGITPSSMPTVVAYFSPAYKDEADRLIDSLRPWGLKREIVPIPGFGSWINNVRYKPTFLLEMLDKVEGPLLYLDADATVDRYPSLFDGMEGDIAVHLRNGRELLSGTIYLNNTDATRSLLKLWERECKDNPDKWDQRCLQTVLGNNQFIVRDLPPEYCAIFDRMPEAGDHPVITHWQASRRLKGPVK